MSVVDDVFHYLEMNGLAGGSTDWTLLRRRMVDDPAHDRCVVVNEDGGVAPEFGAAEGIGDSAMRDPAVMVTVRAAEWDGDASQAKGEEVRAALHGLRDVTLGLGGSPRYYRVRAQSELIFAGFDPQGRPHHTISFRLLRQL